MAVNGLARRGLRGGLLHFVRKDSAPLKGAAVSLRGAHRRGNP